MSTPGGLATVIGQTEPVDGSMAAGQTGLVSSAEAVLVLYYPYFT